MSNMSTLPWEKEGRGRYFLLAGVLALTVFVVVRYLDWRLAHVKLGALASLVYVLALALLILWMSGVDDRQLWVAGLVFVAASVFVSAGWWLIDAHYEEFFTFTRERLLGRSIEEYDSRYVANWRLFFWSPLLLMLDAGVAGLALVTFVVFGYKKARRWG